MTLATQNVETDKFTWSHYAWWPEWSEVPALHGMGWAYDLRKLVQAAQERHRPWHRVLLDASVVGLARLRTRQTLLVGYAVFPVFPTLLKMFLFAQKEGDWTRFQEPVAEIPGLVDMGSDFAQPLRLKLLAFREGRGVPVALWPARKVDGPGILDSGTFSGYFSAPQPPEGFLSEGLLFDLAGPDFVQIPSFPAAHVDWRGDRYEYENRWARIVGDCQFSESFPQ
jgi:hypothetical protein